MALELAALKDNYVYEFWMSQGTNYGSAISMSVAGYLGDLTSRIALISLDVSALAGITITSATLRLTLYSIAGIGNTHWAYKLLHNDWVEDESSFNGKATGVTWDSGDFSAADFTTDDGASAVVPGSAPFVVEWDITALVQDAIDSSINVNLAIMGVSPETGGPAYCTKEHATVASRPLLIITDNLAITTQAVTDIAGATATGNGNITDLGDANPTAHGVCWNTTGTPTIADDKTDEGAASATGAFTSGMTGLTPGLTYKVRAYVTNIFGTSYGSEVSFRAAVIPSVTTNPATEVSILNGTLDDDGGMACDCGFEWGETVAYGNVTLTQSKETGETFAHLLGELSPATTYHFRAFATNSKGTSYGSDQSFATPAGLPTLTTEAASAIGLNGATLNGALTSDGGEPCYCGFEWGATIAYGTTTPTQRKVTGEVFSQPLLHLREAAQYHFRAFATNSSGTAYGEDRTIDTLFRINKAYALARYEV